MCDTREFHPTFDGIAHLMSLSPKSSCQPFLLMRLNIKRVGHAEGRRKIGWRKHKDIQPSEEKNWIHPFCIISCTKVKACVLASILTWFEECGRKKRRKMWRNKSKAIRLGCRREKREVSMSEIEYSADLENCVSESKRKRREKYREQEKIVRDTQ